MCLPGGTAAVVLSTQYQSLHSQKPGTTNLLKAKCFIAKGPLCGIEVRCFGCLAGRILLSLECCLTQTAGNSRLSGSVAKGPAVWSFNFFWIAWSFYWASNTIFHTQVDGFESQWICFAAKKAYKMSGLRTPSSGTFQTSRAMAPKCPTGSLPTVRCSHWGSGARAARVS